MSTPCLIAIENEDKSISCISCHWDGHPEFVGALLKENYTNIETINQLISLGNLSSLGDVPESPSTMWDMNKEPEEGHKLKTGYYTHHYCCSYAARGESLFIGRQSNLQTHIDAAVKHADIEYSYLFKDGEWLLLDWNEKCYKPFTV